MVDISSADLTQIGIAVVSASAVVAGVVVGPWATARADRRKRSSEAAHVRWATARDAYLDLLARASLVELEAESAVAEGQRRQLPGDVIDAYLRAVITAELLSTADLWEEIRPYLMAVVTRINALSPGMNPQVQQTYQQASLDDRLFDRNEIGALRERFVAAARFHIQNEPPHR